jgi:hypothetical protein
MDFPLGLGALTCIILNGRSQRGSCYCLLHTLCQHIGGLIHGNISGDVAIANDIYTLRLLNARYTVLYEWHVNVVFNISEHSAV